MAEKTIMNNIASVADFLAMHRELSRPEAQRLLDAQPTLLVPVHLDGLVVDQAFNSNREFNRRADVIWGQPDPFHADYTKKCAQAHRASSPCSNCDGDLKQCSLRLDIVLPNPFTTAPHASSEVVVPKPFASAKYALKSGVHLHWSMPDGLTRGFDVEGETVFPHLPNRWLVVRTTTMAQVKGGTVMRPDMIKTANKSQVQTLRGKRQVTKGWVIVADGGQLLKSKDDAGAGFSKYHRIVDLDEYDESRCRHLGGEPLTAISSGDPAGIVFYDSCYDCFGFHDDMADVKEGGRVSYQVYGWYAGDVTSPFAEVNSAESLKRKLKQFKWAVGLDLNQEKRAATDDTATIQSSDDLVDSRFLNQGCGLICHGCLFEVCWGESTYTDRKPKADTLFIGIGGSAEGAMSAVLAGGDDGESARYGQLLSGFMDGSLAEIANENHLASFSYLAHKRTFTSLSGGFVEVSVPYTPISSLDRAASRSERGKYEYIREMRKKGVAKGQTPFHSGGTEVVRGHSARDNQLEKLSLLSMSSGYPGLAYGVADIDPGSYGYNAFDTRAAMRTEWSLGADAVRDVIQHHAMQTIKKPLPRLYQSKDPVIVIGGAGRGVKHGEDGRFDQKNRLICRFAVDVVTSVNVAYLGATTSQQVEVMELPVDGEDLLTAGLNLSDLPAGIGSLVYESCLFNPASADGFVELLHLKHPGHLSSATVDNLPRLAAFMYSVQVCEKPQYMADKRFAREVDARNAHLASQWHEAHQDLLWQNALRSSIRIFSGNGRIPSPHGLRYWEQPWTPVHLEWSVTFAPGKVGLDGWMLNGVDYDLKQSFEAGSDEYELSGRTMLTPGYADVLRRAIDTSLDNEQDDDFIPDNLEGTLDDISDFMGRVDLLGTSLGGFNEFLLGEITEMYTNTTAVEASPRVKSWLRSGRLTIKQLRIVDSFGRYIDTEDLGLGSLAGIVGSDEFFDEEAAGAIILPPRITPPARLTFRFLDSEYDGVRESVPGEGRSGICGWCMPDHLDGALEFFDHTGGNVGQLRLHPSLDLEDEKGAGFGVLWEGAPGEDGSYGGTLETAKLNRHMHGIIDGIHGFNRADRSGSDETALSALLRTIDANCWNVDPLGRTGSEHLSVLLGKPLAIVRAKVTFEIKVAEGTVLDEQYEDFCRVPFPVLIGSLKDQTDGVMGFFINDDYSIFHPASPEVTKSTLYNGYGSWRSGGGISAREVRHDFICKEDGLSVRPGQTVVLTLLVDPRGGIHATSGILPQKRLDLIQEEIKPALEKMAVTFMVGPVLVDPAAVRMPHPSEIAGNWSWLHRSSPVVWQDEQISPANDRAHFAANGVEAHEGWLKFAGGVGEGS